MINATQRALKTGCIRCGARAGKPCLSMRTPPHLRQARPLKRPHQERIAVTPQGSHLPEAEKGLHARALARYPYANYGLVQSE